MVDIATVIKSLKITWIRRLYSATDQPFAVFFNENIAKTDDIISQGYDSTKEAITNTKNKFWKDTLTSWKDMCKSTKISSIKDAYSTPLWNNPIISECPIYYPNWYNNGVVLVGDLIKMTAQ